MTRDPLERGAPPAHGVAGRAQEALAPRWRWTLLGFLLLFLGLAASTAYFAGQDVPLARCLDAKRSSLVAVPAPGQGVEARVMVLALPEDGQVRARYEPPERAGQRPRVIIEWSAEPVRRSEGETHERLLSLQLPWADEVEVIDTRGPIPERLPLRLAAERPAGSN